MSWGAEHDRVIARALSVDHVPRRVRAALRAVIAYRERHAIREIDAASRDLLRALPGVFSGSPDAHDAVLAAARSILVTTEERSDRHG